MRDKVNNMYIETSYMKAIKQKKTSSILLKKNFIEIKIMNFLIIILI